MKVFDLVSAASQGKDVMTKADNPAFVEKVYNPYLTNKSFSYHIDSIFFANEINQYAHIDNKFQYLYYVHSVKPRKRFAKWIKQDKMDNLTLIQEVFGISQKKAEEILPLLTEEDIQDIKKSQEQGGVKK